MQDIINEATGEIYVEPGDEIGDEILITLGQAGVKSFETLAIDHNNIGPYIRNTLAVDKNRSREEALMDIYRVMRPGEPPTLETAEAMFQSLFFDAERYERPPSPRKMNARLDMEGEDTLRVLGANILAVVKTLVGLKDGRSEMTISISRHRRVPLCRRANGKPVSIGLLRMERAIRER